MIVEHSPITGFEDKDNLAAPVRALSEFYKALNNRDLDGIERNWLESEQSVMDNPLGGIRRGWEEIRSAYKQLVNGPAKVRVEFYDYSLHQADDVFFAVGRERGEFRIGDRAIGLAIRTTRIYRLIDGRWLQVHHHGSIEDPDLLERYQSAVRKGRIS
jgi:ketosteroid isomerase-like protein